MLHLPSPPLSEPLCLILCPPHSSLCLAAPRLLHLCQAAPSRLMPPHRSSLCPHPHVLLALHCLLAAPRLLHLRLTALSRLMPPHRSSLCPHPHVLLALHCAASRLLHLPQTALSHLPPPHGSSLCCLLHVLLALHCLLAAPRLLHLRRTALSRLLPPPHSSLWPFLCHLRSDSPHALRAPSLPHLLGHVCLEARLLHLVLCCLLLSHRLSRCCFSPCHPLRHPPCAHLPSLVLWNLHLLPFHPLLLQHLCPAEGSHLT